MCNKCDFLICWIFSFQIQSSIRSHWVTATSFRRTVPIAIKCALCGTFITAVMLAVIRNMISCEISILPFSISRTHRLPFQPFRTHIAHCVYLTSICWFVRHYFNTVWNFRKNQNKRISIFSIARIWQTIFCAYACVRVFTCVNACVRKK